MTQHYLLFATLSTTALSIKYAECRVSFIVLLNVVMLCRGADDNAMPLQAVTTFSITTLNTTALNIE
jgi:hypothetical protein